MLKMRKSFWEAQGLQKFSHFSMPQSGEIYWKWVLKKKTKQHCTYKMSIGGKPSLRQDFNGAIRTIQGFIGNSQSPLFI